MDLNFMIRAERSTGNSFLTQASNPLPPSRRQEYLRTPVPQPRRQRACRSGCSNKERPCDLFGQPASVLPTCPAEVDGVRRLVVTQGDTEPASVEQQRLLGQSCPSVYDLRNLFQVNVEEGRHLWAMVYLLHSHFGRDGREEAEALLERRSGDPDKPRILGRLQRAVHQLALVLHVHVLHRSGRQVPAARPGRERLRSAVAHDARSC